MTHAAAWRIVYTKQAQKDASRIARADLRPKAEALLEILRKNPFETPPRFEKLVGDLAGSLLAAHQRPAPLGVPTSGERKNRQSAPDVDSLWIESTKKPHGSVVFDLREVLMVSQKRYPSLHLVGLRRATRRYRDTVLSETAKPSFVSSAWIRGAPQPSWAIVLISGRISASRRGQPRWRRWEIFAQYRRNGSRFYRATVSGFTITNRLAHAAHDWRIATQNARSVSSVIHGSVERLTAVLDTPKGHVVL